LALFQQVIVKKFLQNVSDEKIEKLYAKYHAFYHDDSRAEHIKTLREEQYQEGFFRDLFVRCFEYTMKPENNFNLTTEFKNKTDAQKADGAIIKNGNPIAVIELKSTKTRELRTIEKQAFNYKAHQVNCKYVITSNFEKIRLYIEDATDYQEFNVFYLSKHEFKFLYLCLGKDSIFKDIPSQMKEQSTQYEEVISKKLYQDYSVFRNNIFQHLVEKNPEIDKLALFKKSQKLLDRFLFIFFAEDKGLLPYNFISKIIKDYKQLKELDYYKPLYEEFKRYFRYIDIGDEKREIEAYNGGLFKFDDILDTVQIDDDILLNDSLTLSGYNFNSEIDVNILGHIFEHSLTDIERLNAELSGEKLDIKQTRRKKEGVFYTPDYITKYIVENTVGALCKQKKAELELDDIEIDDSFFKKRTNKLSAKGEILQEKISSYRNWLLQLKILDPACGSGAFLNQALTFLIEEHNFISQINTDLRKGQREYFDSETTILEKNLFGVDINEESVEIAKLSLWLKTAKKGRKLTDLSRNIKCGNSLIDDPNIAGEKAFNWYEEFPHIFPVKDKKAWHVTTATHNSRYSERMLKYNGSAGESIYLTLEDEILISETLSEIIKSDNLNVPAFNVCKDHLHLLIVCEESQLTRIVGKIKAVSSRKYNIEKGITVPATAGTTGHDNAAVAGTTGHVPLATAVSSPAVAGTRERDNAAPAGTTGHVPLATAVSSPAPAATRGHVPLTKAKYNSLWTQKFGRKEIVSETQLNNTINYIRNNRNKHGLPQSGKLEKIISDMTCSTDHAFRIEYSGGFDVVIGNPPYGAALSKEEQNYLVKKFIQGSGETAIAFLKLADSLLKSKGYSSFIIPKSFCFASNYHSVRTYLKKDIFEIVDCGKVWKEVKLEQIIIFFQHSKEFKNYCSSFFANNNIEKIGGIDKKLIDKYGFFLNGVNQQEIAIAEKVTISNEFLNDVSANSRGGIFQKYLSKEGDFSVIGGAEIQRYGIVGIKGKVSKEIVENDEKVNIKDNSILVQRIVAHIENPIDHIKITACIPRNLDYKIVDTINQITVSENFSNLYFWVILNSALINWYAYRFIFGKAIRTMQFDNPTTSRIPIKKISLEAQQPFIEKADLMLSLHQQKQEKEEAFLHRLTSNFQLEKHSQKLKSFYAYPFNTLVKELAKSKIKLSLTQQDEWEEYFNVFKKEINELQTKIEQTDIEIDKMVYELYGLTEEEIAIVERGQ
jgi:REP element-mobilizing transposase RayT/ferritin-like protein